MSQDMRIAYIAGPYRSPHGPSDHWTVKRHIHQAEDYARYIAKACGGRVHCHVPQAATAFWLGPDIDDQQLLDGCLALIRRLDPARDALLILPNSETSAGTTAEFNLARELGISIFRLPEDKRELHHRVLQYWMSRELWVTTADGPRFADDKAAHTAHGSRLTAHRLETGVVQVGDDWPGIFLRGVDAQALSTRIEFLAAAEPRAAAAAKLMEAARLLGSCRANASGYAEAAAQAVHPEAIASTAKLAALLRARIQRRIEANDWDDSIPQLATDFDRHNSALLELLDAELALHPCRAVQGAGSSEVSQ